MTRSRRTSASEQVDLFLPYITDLPLRDQREMMERPFFSLAKSKRIKPIDYRSSDGSISVHVSANPDYGMATIWDADILIYCASTLADMARRGRNDVPRTLHIMPYDLLRTIGRPTTGRAYELLTQALDRLVSTTIKTNIRAEGRREATFSWLDGWTQLVDERTERSRGMTLELSNWFWEGVTMKGGVLAIDRAYFDITGGRERWLYRVARKHAGGAGKGGFALTMSTLFEKSGSEGNYRRFKFELLKLAAKDDLPGYALSVETAKDGEPMLRMRRVDGKGGAGEAPSKEGGPDAQKVSPGKLSAAKNLVALKKALPTQVSDTDALDLGLEATNSPGVPGTTGETHTAPPQEQVNVSSMVRRAVAGLTDAATRGFVAPETAEALRTECPGWDLYALHADFERWVAADPERLPADWQRAFKGWVRHHHAKNRHTLRR